MNFLAAMKAKEDRQAADNGIFSKSTVCSNLTCCMPPGMLRQWVIMLRHSVLLVSEPIFPINKASRRVRFTVAVRSQTLPQTSQSAEPTNEDQMSFRPRNCDVDTLWFIDKTRAFRSDT